MGDNGGTMLGKSVEERERAEKARDQLQSSTQRLEEARVQAYEAEQIGLEVMNDLRQQRDVIRSSRAKAKEVGSNLGQAKNLLGGMMARAKNNRRITIASVVLLVFMVAF